MITIVVVLFVSPTNFVIVQHLSLSFIIISWLSNRNKSECEEEEEEDEEEKKGSKEKERKKRTLL